MEYHIQNSGIDLLIIEDIEHQDYDRTLEILNKYRENGQNSKDSEETKPCEIVFNSVNASDDALGLADELDCKIFNSNEICDFILEKFNVYTGRNLDIIAKENNGSSMLNTDISGMFGFASDDSSMNQFGDDIKLPEIHSKSDIEEFDDTTVRELVREQQKRIELIKAHINQIDKENAESQETDTFEAIDETQEIPVQVPEEPKNDSSGVFIAQINKLTETVQRLNGKLVNLQDRIDKEVELRGAVQDERDALKARLSEIMLSKNVAEEKVPASEYRNIITKYNTVYEEYEKFKVSSERTNKESDERISELQEKITELQEELEQRQIEIEKISQSMESTAADGAANTAALKARIDSLTDKLNKAQTDVQRSEKVIDDLKEQLEYSKRDLGELDKIKHHAEVSDKAANMRAQIINNTLNMLRSYAQDNFDKSQAMQDLHDSLESEQAEKAGLIDKLSERESRIERLNGVIDGLKADVENAQREAEFKSQELQLENTKLRTDLVSASTQIKTLRNSLAAKDASLRQITMKIGPSDPKTGQPKILTDMKRMGDLNIQLQNQIGELQKQLSNTISDTTQMRQNHQKLVMENNRLKHMVDAAIHGTSGQMPMIQLMYNRPGKIIPVFGTSSNGVTSLAYQIAVKLQMNAKVIVMDLDFATPKMDAYFGNKLTVSVPGIQGQYSALEFMMVNGIDNLWRNATTLIPNVYSNKNGSMRIFGGLYHKKDDNTLYSMEWQKLFNLLGQSFDFIVIDCGKYGNSEMADKFIEELWRIAFRVIVVSSIDFFDIRQTVMRVNKLPNEKQIWLLNKAPTTSINNAQAGLLQGKQTVIMPYSQQSMQVRKSLLTDNMLKGRLEAFVSDRILLPARNRNREV